MTIMIEKNVDVDSDGERADFNDRATYEFLFKEYWEIVRDKEGMTLDKLEEAYAILKRGQNCKPDPDLEKLPDEERNSDAEFVGHSDDSDEELSSRAKLNGMTMKIKSFRKGAKSMRNGFVGWGSKELIEFLSSIGKDTSETLDQYGVADVVKNYIRQNDLLQKDKKKLVICDEKLQPLFRKSKVRYNKIHYLLERHIAANMILEDEALASSEDNRDSVMTKKARIASYQPSAPKCTPEINKRCFASLVCDNINLIYLRRSLVVHLLKEPDTFESKVIGCFVRIKNDRKDYSFHMHKKLYQLGQVTGIRKTTEEDKIKDISNVLLCIFNMPDISISMLSDEDFDEEECQDLHLLAQNKSFKRYTVGDLEEKARSLRRDIMSHDEYLDKKQLLRKPSEQQRLLEEVPRVIPEMEDSKDTEVQVTTRDRSTKKSTVAFQGTNAGSTVSLKRCSEEKYKGTNGTRASFFKSTAEEKFKGTGGERELSLKSLSEEKSEATNANTDGGTSVTHTQKPGTEANNVCGIPSVQNLDNNAADKGAEVSVDGDTAGAIVQRQSIEATDVITIDDDDDDHPCEKSGQATVDLDADDAGDTHHAEHKTNNISRRGHRNVKVKRGASLHMRMWHYIDPQGDEQGPFTMEHLRNWWNNGYFRDDFRVWRTGQTSDTAIKLIDALQLIDEVVAVTGPHVVDD
uniref:GYF domain-containing protein n=1 Tax=Setaria italica TaxID=4555 RepID=K3Z4B4_SETIT